MNMYNRKMHCTDERRQLARTPIMRLRATSFLGSTSNFPKFFAPSAAAVSSAVSSVLGGAEPAGLLLQLGERQPRAAVALVELRVHRCLLLQPAAQCLRVTVP